MGNKWVIVFGLALLGAGGASLIASKLPDGLERVAQLQNFQSIEKSLFSGIIPNFHFFGIYSGPLSASLAGILVAVIVVLALFLLGKFLFDAE